MKKSLVAALALTVGVTASAYAANPFSDVPAGHWAYGNIAKLVAAGVVDGYPDGTFQGDKLMTRYEMAQIVAKAMAKGANVDRLASEFADELDALGVRVSKLEKKADNVKITGQIRYQYGHRVTDTGKPGGEKNIVDQHVRSRIWFTGTVNDNWKYVGMLENMHSFSNDTASTAKSGAKYSDIDSEAREGTAFQRAYLEGRLGGAKVKAGRISPLITDGFVYGNRVDGIDANYGKKIRLRGMYFRPTNATVVDYDKAWMGEVSADIGKDLTARTGYTRYTNSVSGKLNDNGLFNIGLAYRSNNIILGLDYLKGTLDAFDPNYPDASNSGYIINAQYKGAKAGKVGSWGLRGAYMKQGIGTFIAPAPLVDTEPFAFFKGQGFKGYLLKADYTVAKNMVMAVEYYNLRGAEESDTSAKSLYGHMIVTF